MSEAKRATDPLMRANAFYKYFRDRESRRAIENGRPRSQRCSVRVRHRATRRQAQNAFTFLSRGRAEQALSRNANASKTVAILETGESKVLFSPAPSIRRVSRISSIQDPVEHTLFQFIFAISLSFSLSRYRTLAVSISEEIKS